MVFCCDDFFGVITYDDLKGQCYYILKDNSLKYPVHVLHHPKGGKTKMDHQERSYIKKEVQT